MKARSQSCGLKCAAQLLVTRPLWQGTEYSPKGGPNECRIEEILIRLKGIH